MMIITSKDNPIIKQTYKLMTSNKTRRKERAFVAEGLRLCEDVVHNQGTVRTAFMTNRFQEEHPQSAETIAAAAARCYKVSEPVMQRLSDTDSPQGVLCVCDMPAFGVLPRKAGRYVILENVSDPANLGAISRTAEALGVDGLLISGGCEVYHPKALRASMGALLRLPVYEQEITIILSHMKQLAVPTFAAVVTGADTALHQVDFSGGGAVIIGNEANGLTSETAAACTARVTIPMAGRAESLNAAAAACIFMWEMTGRGR